MGFNLKLTAMSSGYFWNVWPCEYLMPFSVNFYIFSRALYLFLVRSVKMFTL